MSLDASGCLTQQELDDVHRVFLGLKGGGYQETLSLTTKSGLEIAQKIRAIRRMLLRSLSAPGGIDISSITGDPTSAASIVLSIRLARDLCIETFLSKILNHKQNVQKVIVRSDQARMLVDAGLLDPNVLQLESDTQYGGKSARSCMLYLVDDSGETHVIRVVLAEIDRSFYVLSRQNSVVAYG